MNLRRAESSQSLCVMLPEWWRCAVVLGALNLDAKLGDGHALPPVVCGVESSHLSLWRKVLAVPCLVTKSVDLSPTCSWSRSCLTLGLSEIDLQCQPHRGD